MNNIRKFASVSFHETKVTCTSLQKEHFEINRVKNATNTLSTLFCAHFRSENETLLKVFIHAISLVEYWRHSLWLFALRFTVDCITAMSLLFNVMSHSYFKFKYYYSYIKIPHSAYSLKHFSFLTSYHVTAFENEKKNSCQYLSKCMFRPEVQ